ncbi:LLM class flavin-dependent oxidoreductase [Nitriliruptor alkaliphilus]|uniref:LLM class flavin-dependent oxidoreductase n=1 Tax=Nitriliruptor alkaliphilus TaxID=427918 RepID=UPI001B808DEB|nr:LLM class flavin-dependent oxidoreductase [Nitriliruptor alkaliphilus]
MDTPGHIQLAEELGYTRAYAYDSPTIFADTAITLARAAERTSRIRLGICVITPKMRHLVANAGAIATLGTLASGRMDITVGSGFSSAAMIDQRPAKWAEVEEYVTALRRLLHGEEVEWDGSLIRLCYPASSGVKLECPDIYIAAHGPKGLGVAERVGDGIVTNHNHSQDPVPVGGRSLLSLMGTVLDDGESVGSARALAAAGPTAALALHIGPGGPAADLEETATFAARIEQFDPSRRHIETHKGHLIEVTDLEHDLITEDLLRCATFTGPREEVRALLASLAEDGAAGVLYQPAGPDIPRELRAFAEAAGLG